MDYSFPYSSDLYLQPRTVHINAHFRPPCTAYTNNQYVYQSQLTMNKLSACSVTSGQKQILINPDFVTGMHINPHFVKKSVKQSVHVNPLMFRRTRTVGNVPSNPPTAAIIPQLPKREVILIDEPQCSSTMVKSTSLPKLTPRKGFNKYKLVRNNVETKSKKLFAFKSKFSLDNRVITKRRSSLTLNRDKRLNVSSKSPKCNLKLRNTQYVSINGILYRKSSNSLVTTKGSTSKNNAAKTTKDSSLRMRTNKYRLSANGKKLISNEKVKSQQSKQNHNAYVKVHSNIRLSQIKQRSIQILSGKLRKSNVPCPMFRKFGKCNGKEKGTCIRLHNPDQIALCIKFLQGACFNEKCLLSHKVSAEKMPTCKFFLEGMCSKDHCPYLHVKINAKADICKDFLQGFCEKGGDCDKRHQHLCHDFEKAGKCSRRRCPYPHQTMVRNSKLHHKQNLQPTKSEQFNSKFEQKITNQTQTTNAAENSEKSSNSRYYDDFIPNSSLEKADSGEIPIRPQLGILPSFIPFHSS